MRLLRWIAAVLINHAKGTTGRAADAQYARFLAAAEAAGIDLSEPLPVPNPGRAGWK